jgi:hypothetical protein
MPEQRCETCRFWMDLETSNVGRCRRNAPRHSLILTPSEMKQMESSHHETYLATGFPVTDRREWCGEYQGTPTEPTT